jgi:hypothetical protein
MNKDKSIKNTSLFPSSSAKQGGKGLVAKVWRRKDVCEAMRLTEEQFVELCILIGNDFTGCFDRSLFNKINGKEAIPIRRDQTAINFLLFQLWNNNNINFKASSSKSEELEMAIQYSRSFYELNDLRVFQIEKNLTKENLSKVNNYDRHINFLSTDKKAIYNWFENQIDEIT